MPETFITLSMWVPCVHGYFNRNLLIHNHLGKSISCDICDNVYIGDHSKTSMVLLRIIFMVPLDRLQQNKNAIAVKHVSPGEPTYSYTSGLNALRALQALHINVNRTYDIGGTHLEKHAAQNEKNFLCDNCRRRLSNLHVKRSSTPFSQENISPIIPS